MTIGNIAAVGATTLTKLPVSGGQWSAAEINWLKANAPKYIGQARPAGGLSVLPEYKAKVAPATGSPQIAPGVVYQSPTHTMGVPTTASTSGGKPSADTVFVDALGRRKTYAELLAMGYTMQTLSGTVSMGDYQGEGSGWEFYMEGGQQKAAPVAKPSAPAASVLGGASSSAKSSSSAPAAGKIGEQLGQIQDWKDKSALPDHDPHGLEDTIHTRTVLGDERISRTFLTNLGHKADIYNHQVVNPQTGEVYASADDARRKGVQNWVYKFQFDTKAGMPLPPASRTVQPVTATGTILSGNQALGPNTSGSRVKGSGNPWFKGGHHSPSRDSMEVVRWR